jgi:hypothetical protein
LITSLAEIEPMDSSPMTTREFFFKGNRLLGRLFTVHPVVFAAVFSVLSALCLMLPAWLINLYSIPCTNDKGSGNFGFFHKANWSWTYLILLPVIFTLLIWLTRRIRESAFKLCCEPLNVIKSKVPGYTPDYPHSVSNRLEKLAALTVIVALMVTIVITVADTWDLWWGFSQNVFPCSVKPDWDTAYTGFDCHFYAKNCESHVGECEPLNCSGYSPPTKTQNLLFDIVPYTFQTVVIFLALFWVGKFWTFLQIFSSQITIEDSPYRFDPLVSEKRLGLRPMSKIFNGFLLVTVLFQCFIFGHRIQLIGLFRNNPSFLTYVEDVVKHLGSSDLFFNLSYYAFKEVDTATWVLLSFMTVPIVVICYLPLWSLRTYVVRRREQAWLENVRRRDEAIRENRHRDAENYENKINALNDAEVWPNGDATARRFLIAMGVMGLSSLLPQMFFYLVATGLGIEILFAFLNKPSQVMIRRTEEFYYGDVFENVNNAIIATRGSIIEGAALLGQQGRIIPAEAISALERIITDTSDDELSPEKKVKSNELLTALLEESLKPVPDVSNLKRSGNALWDELKRSGPFLERGSELWPAIAQLWLNVRPGPVST